MKKLMSIMLAAMLAVSCSSVAFAADSTADEVASVTSLEFKKLPDKLVYQLDNEDAGWNYDDITLGDLENNPEVILSAPFFINVDLAGAEIEATYSDGTKAIVDNAECTTSVADPVDLTKYLDMDMDINEDNFEEAFAELLEKMMADVYREFTINVDYQNAQTSFKVSIAEPEIPDDWDVTKLYEFVSYEEPAGNNVYSIEKDLEVDDEIFIFDENEGENPENEHYGSSYLFVDTENITATIRNTETDELIKVTGDDIMITLELDEKPEDVKPGIYTAEGIILTEAGVVTFDYPVVLVNETKKPATDDDDVKGGTSSTLDEPVKKPNNQTTAPDDNKAVQTGTPVAAGVLLALLLAGTVFVYYTYKAKP